MRFFTSLYFSLGNLPWLKAQKKYSGKAWGYFFLFTLLMSVLLVIPVAVALPGVVNSVKSDVLTKLPAFSAQVRAGELSVTELTQPFVARGEENGAGFVFVVDTTSTTSPNLNDYLHDNEIGVLVSKKSFTYYNDANGEMSTRSWSDVGDFSVTKDDITNWTNRYLTAAIMPVALIAMLVGLYVGLTVSKLLGLLTVSFLVWVVAMASKKAWSFGELFTVGLFAQTLPSIIALVLPWLGLSVSSVFFLALLAFMLALVFTKEPAEIDNLKS